MKTYKLQEGYTISMYVQFDGQCTSTADADDLSWSTEGCSLLQYSLGPSVREERLPDNWKTHVSQGDRAKFARSLPVNRTGPQLYHFACTMRRPQVQYEPWRVNNYNDASIYEEASNVYDVHACATTCRSLGYPFLEIGGTIRTVGDYTEQNCKCFHTFVAEEGFSTQDLGQDTMCKETDTTTCKCTHSSFSNWFTTTDASTLGIGVRNGKIYFGDNAQIGLDCGPGRSQYTPYGPTWPSGDSLADSACVGATPSVPLFTAHNDYNDGKFHHVVAEYNKTHMRLRVQRSNGAYDSVERSIDNENSPIDFRAEMDSLAAEMVNIWPANPHITDDLNGGGYIELDFGIWTLNAGGDGGHAGANMHSIRVYEGAVMDRVITENSAPQAVENQNECTCTMLNPPSVPPSPPPPPPVPSPPPPPPSYELVSPSNRPNLHCDDYDWQSWKTTNVDDGDPDTNSFGMKEIKWNNGNNYESYSIAECKTKCTETPPCNMINLLLEAGVQKCNLVEYNPTLYCQSGYYCPLPGDLTTLDDVKAIFTAGVNQASHSSNGADENCRDDSQGRARGILAASTLWQ